MPGRETAPFQETREIKRLLCLPTGTCIVPGLLTGVIRVLPALLALAREAKALLDGRFHPDGYNLGVNVGKAAGQTVMHLHVHLIPRYAGDVADPRGGVRGAVPEKRVY